MQALAWQQLALHSKHVQLRFCPIQSYIVNIYVESSAAVSGAAPLRDAGGLVTASQDEHMVQEHRKAQRMGHMGSEMPQDITITEFMQS